MAGRLKKFSHVVAVEKNNGIAYKMKLPWPRIPTDLKFMNHIITTTNDPDKENAIIMGRLTWESIPKRKKSLSRCFYVVLSSRPSSEILGAHLVCSSLSLAMEHISSPPLSDKIENVLILGGAEVYREALASPLSDKIYYTEVLGEYKSDVFWPGFDETQYELIEDEVAPKGIFEENGVKFRFLVYQKIN